MNARFGRKFLVAVFLLLASLSLWAQIRLPMAQQKQIFNEALQEVLKRNPTVASEVRILGVGSWMIPGISRVGDVDATVGHPDPGVAKALVADMNREIAKKAQALNGTHKINVIFDGDTSFRELFRGETGQAFILSYAKGRAPDGLATGRFVDGQVVFDRPAEAFWSDQGKKLPGEVTHPEHFFEDAFDFAKGVKDKPPLDAALSFAKQGKNVEGWLVPVMETKYNGGQPIDALRMDPKLKEQMDALRELKATGGSVTEVRADLTRILGVPPSEHADALREFSKQMGDYLKRGQVVAGVIDEMHQATHLPGALPAIDKIEASLLNKILTLSVDVAERAAKLGIDLGATTAERAGRFADIALLAYEASSTGHIGADDLLSTLIGWGVPQAQLAALAAEIGRVLVVGGVTLAGNTMIFNAINDAQLKQVFDPGFEWGVYGGHDFALDPNPFKFADKNGVIRAFVQETLCYDFPDLQKFREAISLRAQIYLPRLRNSGRWFATEGAGAFTPERVEQQLVADWGVSCQLMKRVGKIEGALNEETLERPDMPFRVAIDGNQVVPFRPWPLSKKTTPGRPVTFSLRLTREFGTVRALRPEIQLVDVWAGQARACAPGAATSSARAAEPVSGPRPRPDRACGMAELQRWLAENWDNDQVFAYRYDTGEPKRNQPKSVVVEVWVKNAKGWLLDGRWPVNFPVFMNGASSATDEVKIVNRGGLVRAQGPDASTMSVGYPLTLTPTRDAGPVEVIVHINFTDTFDQQKPSTTPYRMQLTASLEPVVETMAPPVVPDRGRDRAEPPPRPEPAALPKPTPVTPPAPPAPPDYSVICQSAMVAIERGQRASYGPQAQVRVEWVKPFAYDKGDCVGGYVLWVKRPEDKTEWAPTRWFADTGAGRVPASGLVKQYSESNPDLPWIPATTARGPAPSRAADEAAQLEQAKAAAAAAKARADQAQNAAERARAAAERARELDAARKQEAQAPAATNAGDDSAQKWDALRAQAQQERERQARLTVPGPTPAPTAPPDRPKVSAPPAPVPQTPPAPRAPAPPPAGPVAGSAVADGTYTIGFAFDGKTFNGSLDVRGGHARGTVTARVEGELLLPGNGIRLIGGTFEVDGSVSGQTITGSYTLTGSARLKGLYGGVVRASNFNVAGRGTLAVQLQPGGRLVWTSDGELHVPAQPDWPGDGHKTGPVTGTWSTGASSSAPPPAAPCPPAPIPGVGGLETNVRCFGIPK